MEQHNPQDDRSSSSMPSSEPTAEKNLATNARARHLYHIRDRFEAGLVLTGSEVKALREGRANLREAYAAAKKHELFLYDCHIGPYSHTGYSSHEPMRPRKLLLHGREIRKIIGKLTLRGLTMVALRLYLKAGRVKVELAVVEGKKLHDKRDAQRQKDRPAE